MEPAIFISKCKAQLHASLHQREPDVKYVLIIPHFFKQEMQGYKVKIVLKDGTSTLLQERDITKLAVVEV